MKEPGANKPVERLFPFAIRSRCIIVGRDALARSRKKLHFILITHDLSEGSRERILYEFKFTPIVQHYSSADLEKLFGLKGTKVLGFTKAALGRSIYSEMKEHQVNTPQLRDTPPRHTAPAPSRAREGGSAAIH